MMNHQIGELASGTRLVGCLNGHPATTEIEIIAILWGYPDLVEHRLDVGRECNWLLSKSCRDSNKRVKFGPCSSCWFKEVLPYLAEQSNTTQTFRVFVGGRQGGGEGTIVVLMKMRFHSRIVFLYDCFLEGLA